MAVAHLFERVTRRRSDSGGEGLKLVLSIRLRSLLLLLSAPVHLSSSYTYNSAYFTPGPLVFVSDRGVEDGVRLDRQLCNPAKHGVIFQ